MPRKRPKSKLGRGKSKSPSKSSTAFAETRKSPGRPFTAGNTAAIKHGRFSRRARQALLPGQEAQLAALNADKNQLLEDLGGADQLTVTKRQVAQKFCELTVIADTIATNLLEHGVLSAKGRGRAALSAYLSVVDRLNKLATQLGLERTPKSVPSIDDYLKKKGA